MKQLALSALVALTSFVASPAGSAAADEPATHSCNWVSKAPLNDAGNWLWPDDAADYVLGVFAIPHGGHVELKGEFPHARYLSFQSFDLRTRAFDLVQDFEIQPDPGSENPFVTNADRQTTQRSYTLKIVEGRVPTEQRPPNTIYNQSQTGSPSAPGLAIVLLRSYLPDAGRDSTGDVGWPEVTTVAANGKRSTTLKCPAVQLPIVMTPLLKYLSIPGSLPDVGLSGYNPPRWFRTWDSYPELILNTFRSPLTDFLPLDSIGAALPGTSIGNLSTGYLYSTFNQSHGRVLVLEGRAPTHPDTHGRNTTMGSGQVRYWSFCSNTDATQYVACLYDEQVPVDANGNYRIVVSPAADRPANARESCGLAWLPSTPRAVVILRNILADPNFHHAVKSITKRGDEESVMGPYFPRGTYYATATDVENELGCQAPIRPDASSSQ